MTYSSFAVIGTAGRREDKALLTHAHYDRMVEATAKLFTHLQVDNQQLKVYSGGAAWADHIAVTLALLRAVDPKNVTLYLPTDLDENGFFGTDEKSNKTASTANYYHRVFSDTMGYSSLQQLLDLKRDGGSLVGGTGNFFQRNSDVAKAVTPDGLLLAWTFGDPNSTQPHWTLRPFAAEIKAEQAGLRDGGTADTFNKAKCLKWHGMIGKEP